jgi:DNA modification methylase
VAAVKLNRNFIGNDISNSAIEIAKANIDAALGKFLVEG